MSTRRAVRTSMFTVPVAEFQYPSTIQIAMPERTEEESPREPEVRITESELSRRLADERTLGIAEAEARLRQEFESQSKRQLAKVDGAITAFDQSRKSYFTRVEGEIVQLALAIAAKILHRESQVDPLLLGALVQIALGQLKDGSIASIRVRPEEVKMWRDHFASVSLPVNVSVVGDADLEPKDMILETELGTVNFSLDVQLKEVQQGFFDVLAQKPQS